VIGYACTWLTWTCLDWGLLNEAVAFGERAQETSGILKSDHYLFYKSLAGIGHTHWFKGECAEIFKAGKTLLDYGKKHSSIRSLVVGHIYTGTGYLSAGDFTSAIDSYNRAIKVAADPFYSHWGRIFLGLAYVNNSQFSEAEEALTEIMSYCVNFGCEYIRPYAYSFLGLLEINKGHISQGLKMLEKERQSSIKNERKVIQARIEYIMGKVYLQVVQREGKKSMSVLAKNIGFLVKEVPFADKKAENHFNKAIDISKEIGAKGLLGNVYLDLGLLHEAKGRTEQARKFISDAIKLFEQCGAEGYSKQAREVSTSLG